MEWLWYLTNNSKYQGLDFLRAIAIASVILWHSFSYVFRFGWIGVDLFFVLSGFLIGSILFSAFESGTFSYYKYMKSRVLRIYPLYVVTIVLFMALLFSMGSLNTIDEAFKVFVSQAFFVQTIIPHIFGIDIPYFQPTWSLVVEIFFYLTAPMVVLLLLKTRMLWKSLLVVFILFLMLRLWLSSGHPPDDKNWQFFLFLRPYYRYDELLFGVAVAYAVNQNIGRFKNTSLILGCSIIVLACAYIYKLPGADATPSMLLLTRDGVLMPTVLALGFSLVMYAVYDVKISHPLINAVARLAYPLYLMHVFVFHEYNGFFGYVVLSFVVAIIFSYSIEYPFIRMYKDKREKSSPMAIATAT
jgi:peptidoglycan/LPS O-acetylase OafA/YrhL